MLSRIIDIQGLTLEHTRRGVSQEWVYNNLVLPQYRISKRTFYNYLACSAKRELGKLESSLLKQATLF